jgi:predicted alpha/beta hydrolase family esterase
VTRLRSTPCCEVAASQCIQDELHAKDDPNVPDDGSEKFAEITGVTLKSLKRGGHISTHCIVRRYWTQIKKFFDSARNE